MNVGDDECWLWTGKVMGRDTRPYFSINGKKWLAYRVVYEVWYQHELQPGEMVRHTCDNRQCCNPKHLELGSHQQNMDDMKARQRHGLPHHVVRHIKRLILKAVPNTVIAERYGVSEGLIRAVKTGKIYSHVELQDGRYSDPLHGELDDVED